MINWCSNLFEITRAFQVIVVRDAVVHDCRVFLSQCEQFGGSVRATLDVGRESSEILPSTVASEARVLLALFALINE